MNETNSAKGLEIITNFFSNFEKHSNRAISKWPHYLNIYAHHFEKFRQIASTSRKIKIMEIGLRKGGSIELWNEYFGKNNCEIYGLDVDETCKNFEGENVKVFIGDQANRQYLIKLASQLSDKMDIIIDDGGHQMNQQINSFEILFPELLSPGGVYLCEDTHTSYWTEFGGSYRNPSSFVEYAKSKIDELHSFHIRDYDKVDASLKNSFVSKWCHGIYFYDSIVIFEKLMREKTKPFSVIKGQY